MIEYLILADAVQVVDGKLYVTGGGWDTLLVPGLPQSVRVGIACGVGIPWSEAKKEHALTVSVTSADGRPLAPAHRQTFRTGRGPDLQPGADAHVPFAVTWELTFPEPGLYVVSAGIDGRKERERRLRFSVREAGEPEPAISEEEMNVIDEELSTAS